MKLHATVIREGEKLLVEITDKDDYSQTKPIVICSIPCVNALQAWAVADAYNYPGWNKNAWRDEILK